MKKIMTLILFVAANPFFDISAQAAEKRWSDAAELSMVNANGNTNSSSTSGKNTYGYKWTKTNLELITGGLGAKNNGVVTAEQYYANEKVSYKLTDRNYTFEKFGWDKDRFAGINNRYDGQLGLGRELIATKTDNLIGEIGGGYINEERINAPVNKFASGRVYSKYIRTLSPTSNFSQDAEYLANFEDKDDFRVNTVTGLTAAISTHFSLKLSYTWKHVGKPPVGFGRNDTTTAVALIANY